MTAICVVAIVLTMIGSAVCVELWRRSYAARAVTWALSDEVVALRAEAMAMAVEIARRHMENEALDAAFFGRWRLSEPIVYPAVGVGLGLLPSRDAIGRVGYFHAQLANARVRLAEARATGRFEPSPYRVLGHLLRASHDAGPWVQKHRRRLPRCAWEQPDTSQADALLEAFERTGAEPLIEPYWPL